MARSLEVSYWLTLLLAIPTAGFLVRIFIIQHDCGHGSFLRSRRAMDWVGSLCGVLTLVPYHDWRKSHAIHHASSGHLSHRGTGDVYTWTVREYLGKSRRARLMYRVYRHPLVLFVIIPTVLFVILYRFPSRSARGQAVARGSVLSTNLFLLGISSVLVMWLGLKEFLMVQVPITLITCTVGVWLFYIQHQFEETYWADGEDWDYAAAAMHGSSYYKLPRVLHWFTGNIGFHHIHHLSPRIPNYHLERCHEENPMFQRATTITLRSSLKSIPLALWDEEEQRLVGFGHLKRLRTA